MERRELLKAAASGSLAAGLAFGEDAIPKHQDYVRLFPTDLPWPEWLTFATVGFGYPACGVVFRLNDKVTNGLALGGIDTGCIDLETSGILGYCTIFNTHVPRRGPLNVPILGLSVGGKTWVLCDKQPKRGYGSSRNVKP